MRLLRDYLYVGGMPEPTYFFAEHPDDYEGVRSLQQNILAAYQLDFAKHAPKDQVVRIGEVFAVIPSQLAKENKKFIFNVIAKSARARDYGIAIQWLIDAGLLLRIRHISDVTIPLLAHSDPDFFKIYFLDVGLLGAMFDVSQKLLLETAGLFTNFKGALAENFVAQELTAYGKSPLFY
jgi:predicted AAA+ superfamily ATPase